MSSNKYQNKTGKTGDEYLTGKELNNEPASGKVLPESISVSFRNWSIGAVTWIVSIGLLGSLVYVAYLYGTFNERFNTINTIIDKNNSQVLDKINNLEELLSKRIERIEDKVYKK